MTDHTAHRIRNKAVGQGPVLLITFLLIAVCCLFSSKVNAFASEIVGQFTHVEGKVDLLREGALPAKNVNIKDPVMLKDIIRTKSNSKAEITLRDNTVLRIAQRSRIDISEYFTGDSKNKGVVKLSRGQMQAMVDKTMAKRISAAPNANTFEIHTPNAVAGVRGTDFFVSYDRDVTTVLLKEGEVCIYNLKFPSSVTCLPPNFIVTITGANIPAQPRKATNMELQIFERETSPMLPAAKGFSGIAPPASAAAASLNQGALITPLSSSATDAPANITDIPISKPITEQIPITEQPKTSESAISASIWSNFPTVSDGSFNALMKSTDTLWIATQNSPATMQLTGTYSAGSSLPHIWFQQDVFSNNTGNGTKTTFDGGAYRGFIGGTEISNASEAAFLGLFIDPSGNTGFLKGNVTGTTTGSSLSMNGGLYPVRIGTSTISPADFYNAISTSVFSVNGPSFTNDVLNINVVSGAGQTMNINGQNDWGISQILLNGTYTDSVNDSWSLSLSNSSDTGQFNADLQGNKWSQNKVNAAGSGYWVDASTASPLTGIYIGETIGTFNPADHTWQAVSSGILLETNRLLQMASTANGRNSLQQLNIPAFEVGRTSLSGSLIEGQSGSFDHVSVFMNDVVFLAPSTGQKPGIWATNAVSGQYDFTHGFITPANITGADSVIAITNGGNISADFQFKNWNTANNTWTAGVNNGTGNLSGGSYSGPVNFNGVAAGTRTGINSGSFTGTGAGTVR